MNEPSPSVLLSYLYALIAAVVSVVIPFRFSLCVVCLI